jgi:hypothetical protein
VVKPRKSNEFGQRWAVWKLFEIKGLEGSVYLRRRRIVQTPWFGVYHHRIFREDQDRHLHSHPWPFLSAVLTGGYREVVAMPAGDAVESVLTHRAGRIHRFPDGMVHKIVHVEPGTRTLVLVGRRRESWGFYVPGRGIVPWRTYLAEQNHPQAPTP